MDGQIQVRRLRPPDVTALVALRREALLTEPLVFGASPEDDRGLSADFLREALGRPDEQAVFGALAGGRLVGMIGLVRQTARKRRHRAHLWGMFVLPATRGRGVGRALLCAAIEQARAWPGVERLQLSVTAPARAARSLYEAAGFRVWGEEPGALAWEGRCVDEAHLTLDLRAPDASL